jgi:hypothetical protein
MAIRDEYPIETDSSQLSNGCAATKQPTTLRPLRPISPAVHLDFDHAEQQFAKSATAYR